MNRKNSTGNEAVPGRGENINTHPEHKDHFQQGFCVSLPADGGKPAKLTGTNPHEFIPLLKEASVAWLNFQVKDIKKDAEIIAMSLGFSSSLVPAVLSEYLAAYEDRDTELGLMMPAVVVDEFEVHSNPILILIRKDLILTIHDENVDRLIRFSRYADAFMRKINTRLIEQDKITIILTRIIDVNITRNFDHLRKIQVRGDELSKILMEPLTSRDLIAPEIYNMKHALITYLDTLWATLDVVNSLRHGDAELMTDSYKLLARLGILSDDVNRHIALSEHMSTVLATGLEVLQSVYNNQLQVLNNRLALVVGWLTLLGTAVLVPNTLATIYSNPAYGMTIHDRGWFTVLMVVSTILSTWVAYWWVKKKGLLEFEVN